MAGDQGKRGADDGRSETSGHGRPHSITTIRGGAVPLMSAARDEKQMRSFYGRHLR
jgi:hypothetical protein